MADDNSLGTDLAYPFDHLSIEEVEGWYHPKDALGFVPIDADEAHKRMWIATRLATYHIIAVSLDRLSDGSKRVLGIEPEFWQTRNWNTDYFWEMGDAVTESAETWEHGAATETLFLYNIRFDPLGFPELPPSSDKPNASADEMIRYAKAYCEFYGESATQRWAYPAAQAWFHNKEVRRDPFYEIFANAHGALEKGRKPENK